MMGSTHCKLAALALLLPCTTWGAVPASAPDTEAQRWVEQFKTQRLGPFESVRWFCTDGSVLPPEPYACRERGGGRQHGLRSAQSVQLREQGILLGNVLAEIDPPTALADHARVLKAIAVEQHLASLDDGWIFRQTRYARGAFQIEDETAAAAKILAAMAGQARYSETDFLLFRELIRRLPSQQGGSRLDALRANASALAARDPGFAALRNKIHSRPDIHDAEAVRSYAQRAKDDSLKQDYAALATELDATYQQQPLTPALTAFGERSGDPAFVGFGRRWEAADQASTQLEIAASALALIRLRLTSYRPANRLAAMQLSLLAEDAAFVAARGLAAQMHTTSRAERLDQLRMMARAIYGSGLLTERENIAIRELVTRVTSTDDILLQDYRTALEALARVPVWTANRLNFYFGETLKAFARVEPKTNLLIPDRLRSSPALSYGEILESLAVDADQLAGIRQDLFGKTVSSGLRGLNPGLARGPLMTLDEAVRTREPQAIVLAPESAADLPAVAGILTAAEGNALSHVQLLARNLGVPNVVVGDALLDVVRGQLGKTAVLAVSPAGVVRLSNDSPEWQARFSKQTASATLIVPDLKRLDLSQRDFLNLTRLRADDSGRSVGPKAAKLGELMARYPDQVSPGLAIPFGRFRAALDSPFEGSLSVFEWMKSEYAVLDQISAGPLRDARRDAFLTRLRGWLESYQFPEEFKTRLKQQMLEAFGAEGSYGVFVRSDTNVEDLPGFTGAGLNLTVPHVVGFDATLDAIRRVWASPFTERAFGWRQALMDEPEHVYTAVLLHKTVPAVRSGVMITADLATGSSEWITVATNEGVGGGVEGQAAESLRINLNTGEVELLASATEATLRAILPGGGSKLTPALAPAYLLSAADIEQLLQVARSLPEKYPTLLDAQGKLAPADVEFAYANDVLFLNQIRPFLQSERARKNEYLLTLDEQFRASAQRRVALGDH